MSATTYFIPSEKLGKLEDLVREYPLDHIKRKRQIGFREIEVVLKGLKLIPRKAKVLHVAFGFNRSGDVGMYIGFEPCTHVNVQLPDAKGESK